MKSLKSQNRRFSVLNSGFFRLLTMLTMLTLLLILLILPVNLPEWFASITGLVFQ
ncbi:MAG: hypothetical protein IH914_10840 [candidate division Zixibacteria bacterium]|nr:hypothetical protein [candidate division Zixibacteria bacterium]